MRLAIVASHPVPYQVPLYRALAKEEDIELLVLYGDDYGMRPRMSGWGVDDFVWEADLTSGYRHEFVPNVALRPHPSHFLGKLNPSLFSRLRVFAPDAVLISGYSSVYQLQTIVCARLLSARLLYYADTNVLRDPSGARGLLKRHLLRRLYGSIDAFLVIGARNRQHFERTGVDAAQMHRFALAVDNAYFQSRAKELGPRRQQLRDQWGIPHDAVCFFTVSRLEPHKNIEEVIGALATVPKSHLLVVGTGSQAAALQALGRETLGDRCSFAGFLNASRVANAYAAGDVLVMPSRFEAWGLSCNEAMNFGCPVIVSDRVGAGTDLVVEGVTGYVYPLGDLKHLRRALAQMASRVRDDAEQLARAARSRVNEYGIETQVAGVRAALSLAPGG